MKTKRYPKSYSTGGWRLIPLPAWIVLGLIWLVSSQDLRSATANSATPPAGPTFTRITTGPIVEDPGIYWADAWVDYDDDGDVDLFVTAGDWPVVRSYNRLYRNDGNGAFTKMTTNEVGDLVNDFGAWYGSSWGDYDNDGDLDVHVCSSTGTNALYRNDGHGVFARVRDAGPIVSNQALCQSGPWADYDNDGLLDLFTASLWSGGLGWLPSRMALHHNDGNGQFTLVTNTAMWDYSWTSSSFGGTEMACWGDYDDDGDVDLCVSIDSEARDTLLLFENNGRGGFTEVTDGAIATYTGGGIHVMWGDYDKDGRLDLAVGEDGGASIFFNEGGNQWTVKTILLNARVGILAWADYDNDGDLDLFASGGPASPVRNQFFVNNGDRTFTELTNIAPATYAGQTSDGVWGDYDNDGFMDLYVPHHSSTPGNSLLYHNDGNSNRWLMVKLVGTASNRSAIGAKVRARATVFGNTFWQRRDISGGMRTQHDMRAHFGLGDATNVEVLRIEWPSGIVQEIQDVTANQFLTIQETGVRLEPRTVVTAPGSNVTLRATVVGVSSPRYQWKLNGTNLPGATTDTLLLNNIQVADAGTYTVEVSDGTHTYLSNPSAVSVFDKPVITQQPQSLTVLEGGNAAFTVVAISATPIRYQWRFNGTELADETSSTLTVANVQAKDVGPYDVVVSDSFGSITSQVATLTVALPPRPPSVTQIVTNYTVVQGGSVTLSVETSGALPMGYRWRRNNSNVKHEVLSSHQSFLVLSNVQPSIAGSSNRYWVILTNVAHVTPGVVSPNIYLTVLPDSDGDGMDDAWESDNGFNPDNPADAALDWDGDGQSNGQEYQAGTDPLMLDSYLKVDRIAVSGEAQIEFRAASNTTYTVLYAESLTPPRVWWKLADIAASPESRTVVVTDPDSNAQRYYRLVTPAQP